MPAKLVITAGDPVGREIPIQFPVLRIGSGASCEVQLRGISDVAATLRYEQSRYLVLNRGAEPITLNGQMLAPQQSGHWAAHTELRLTALCALTLEIEGDPAPRNVQPLSRESFDQVSAPTQPEREPEEDEDAAVHDEPPPKPKADSKKAFQMTVIALCVVAGAYLQFQEYQKKNGGGGSAKSGVVTNPMLREKFSCLVEELMNQEKHDSHFRFGVLRETLQQGRIADISEDWNSAAYSYREVLDQMEALELTAGEEEDVDEVTGLPKSGTASLRLKPEEYRKLPLEKRLSEFVRQRLTQIDPKVSKFTDPDA